MSACSISKSTWGIIIIVVLFVVIGIPLIYVFGGKHESNKPNFTVQSTTVKAYNLTSDDELFCIINVGVKAHNPNPGKYYFNFAGIDMEVRKGKHHKLADDALWSFGVGPGGYRVVDVEAVGLRVALKKKIATEVRDDAAAGEGRVSVYMAGNVGEDLLRVVCKNVAVDFSRSTVRVDQEVHCGVTVITTSSF